MGAGYRAVFQLASGHTHQHLGRRPEDLRVSHSQKVEIRRRIDLAQGAVKIERLDAGDKVEALREHDLKDVACGDVFFAALDAAQELRPRSPGMDFEFSWLGLNGL